MITMSIMIQNTITIMPYTLLKKNRHEPIGVCGQIIPWNYPIMMLAWKFGPAVNYLLRIVSSKIQKLFKKNLF